MKKFLFVMRHAPHQGVRLQELLDVVLITSAFDQTVSLLFLDNGVFQLKKNQQSAVAGLKDTLAILSALELYDINELVVEVESMQQRYLQNTDLALPVRNILREELAAYVGQFDVVY